ncbi:MAG: Fic family protein [Candidatus Firestonebacteria bacterium]|mgnify:CR=1 FL=1
MVEFFKLEIPDCSKVDTKKIILKIVFEKNIIDPLIQQTSQPYYIYWDKFKYKKNITKEYTHEELWAAIKWARKMQSKKSVIKNEKGNFFVRFNLSTLDEFFHEIDLNAGGSLFAPVKDIDEKNKFKFISRGVVEEAIASSQLEGANTTRQLAKQFLREGRKPRIEAEHMILNNYNAMVAIEQEYKKRELDRNMLFDLHSMIVKNTAPKEEQGIFRIDKDDIVVSDEKFVYHIPPKIAFVENEINRLIEFANDKMEVGDFVHPVLKAIKIHFWIGYLHPFTNGNGRLARLLFYWYLLRKGYWAFAYLPISTIIKRSPSQYKKAYIYSEQDELDLTYFIDYHIRKIKLAIKDFQLYLKKKAIENKRMNSLAKKTYHLNDRQIQLLQYYYKNKEEYTNPKMHIRIYQISKKTAINDLKGLKHLGFVSSQKVGRNIHYYATDKVEELFI